MIERTIFNIKHKTGPRSKALKFINGDWIRSNRPNSDLSLSEAQLDSAASKLFRAKGQGGKHSRVPGKSAAITYLETREIIERIKAGSNASIEALNYNIQRHTVTRAIHFYKTKGEQGFLRFN